MKIIIIILVRHSVSKCTICTQYGYIFVSYRVRKRVSLCIITSDLLTGWTTICSTSLINVKVSTSALEDAFSTFEFTRTHTIRWSHSLNILLSAIGCVYHTQDAASSRAVINIGFRKNSFCLCVIRLSQTSTTHRASSWTVMAVYNV